MITMAAKQLVIMVFVFACSTASEEETIGKNPEQMVNSTGTKFDGELESFQDYFDGPSSDPVDSTSTTDGKLPTTTTTTTTTTTNNYVTNEAESLNKAHGGSEEVPKIKDQSQNKTKRETNEKKDSNHPIVNKMSTPVTMSTETSQKDAAKENYESTTKSVLGSSRPSSNNEEFTSGRVINNESKEEQVTVKSSGSTNKQPFRNSNTTKNDEKDHKNYNKDKPINVKKNKPITKHNTNNDVFYSKSTKPKLDNNEDEDSAQPNEYQIMSSEEPRRRKSSSRGKARGRQADEKSCESQEDYDDSQKTRNQGTEPKHVPKIVHNEGTQGIQGEESKILPEVRINVTTVVPTNKPSTTTSTILTKVNSTVPTTVTTNLTQNTLQPSNNSTTSHPPTNAKSKKWKKALDIFGRVIGVFTVIGGAFYLVYSVM